MCVLPFTLSDRCVADAAATACTQVRSELSTCKEALSSSEQLQLQASVRIGTLEHDVRSAKERLVLLEADLTSSNERASRLEVQVKALEVRERALQGQIAQCGAERERATARLEGLPEALRTLQARLSETLLRPIEETLKVELAPPHGQETGE